jgi:hypothetical protein
MLGFARRSGSASTGRVIAAVPAEEHPMVVAALAGLHEIEQRDARRMADAGV